MYMGRLAALIAVLVAGAISGTVVYLSMGTPAGTPAGAATISPGSAAVPHGQAEPETPLFPESLTPTDVEEEAGSATAVGTCLGQEVTLVAAALEAGETSVTVEEADGDFVCTVACSTRADGSVWSYSAAAASELVAMEAAARGVPLVVSDRPQRNLTRILVVVIENLDITLR